MYIFNAPNGESYFYDGKQLAQFPTIGLKEVILLLRQNRFSEADITKFLSKFPKPAKPTKVSKK